MGLLSKIKTKLNKDAVADDIFVAENQVEGLK